MRRAIAVAERVRMWTSPNPWVGCVVVTADGRWFEGATAPPGGAHAEVSALSAAGDRSDGSTLYATLEPCSHHGRTPPCTDRVIQAGVARVVIGVTDPDPHVAGRGIARLRAVGIEVVEGVLADEIGAQLRPYLHHRTTGRPFVVLKLASTLDGRTAAPDGTSRWITSSEARRAVHRLRAESDAICVGRTTVLADDPALTVRHVEGPDPRRVVLGAVPEGAAAQPCLSWTGELDALLDHLGGEGVLQLLVEGGATTAAAFHRAGLVDRYVLHLAPALFGGDDARPLFGGLGVPTIERLWRGRVVLLRMLGPDIEIVVEPSDVPTEACSVRSTS